MQPNVSKMWEALEQPQAALERMLRSRRPPDEGDSLRLCAVEWADGQMGWWADGLMGWWADRLRRSSRRRFLFTAATMLKYAVSHIQEARRKTFPRIYSATVAGKIRWSCSFVPHTSCRLCSHLMFKWNFIVTDKLSSVLRLDVQANAA